MDGVIRNSFETPPAGLMVAYSIEQSGIIDAAKVNGAEDKINVGQNRNYSYGFVPTDVFVGRNEPELRIDLDHDSGRTIQKWRFSLPLLGGSVNGLRATRKHAPKDPEDLEVYNDFSYQEYPGNLSSLGARLVLLNSIRLIKKHSKII